MINLFDTSILSFLNGFAQRSWMFDSAIGLLATGDLWKGGVFVTVIWWLWFRREADKTDTRDLIISTIGACCIGLILARTLAFVLPFRVRPLHVPELHFVRPYGVERVILESWSAFPSDHAVLFFALAMGIFSISRAAGILGFAYALLIVSLPRIYLGFHYPTDVVVGALIGIAIAYVVNLRFIRERVARPVRPWPDKYPGLFYAGFFLLGYELAALFWDLRQLARFAYIIFESLR